MQRLADEHPYNQAELERVLSEVPWRVEHFGDQILDVMRKA